MARTPSLAAPAKAALQIQSRFVDKVEEHPAIRSDPLLAAQAQWLRGILDDFAVLVARRAKEQANG